MNIKEAIYQEIKTISALSGTFTDDNIWQGFVPRDKTEHQNDSPEYQLIFYSLPYQEARLKNTQRSIEFRVIGKDYQDNILEQIRDIVVDHFSNINAGKMNNTFITYAIEKGRSGEVENFDSNEKEIYFQLIFHYIRGASGSL